MIPIFLRRAAFVLTAATAACSGAEGASPPSSSIADAETDVIATTTDAPASEVAPDARDDSATDAVPSIDAGADVHDAAAATVFSHPGVIVNGPQLDFLKAKIAAGAEPWTSALAKAKASSSASLTLAPAAISDVVCGSYSNPDIGCTDEKTAAIAAYTDALIWALTDDEAYAKKSIEIMNAWASTITTHTNSNAPLQSAWVASQWPRAGDIIRATYPAWSASEIAKFSTMLRKVYLPEVIGGSSSNGNWELSMAEATIAIGVFLDDQATFDAGVALWRRRVPAYIYLSSDGALPKPPPVGTGGASTSALEKFWYGETKFVDGVAQETCRDLGHTQLGFAAMINAAETARIQGVDLYGEQRDRIVAGLEFNAQYLDGTAVPSWLCGGSLTDPTATAMWEIAFNEYGTRLGLSLPHTQSLVTKGRPTGTNHHMAWETLTHAEVGSVGLP